MIYLLDANACIRFLQGRTAQLLERFAAVSAAEKHLCSVVIGELYYGAFKSEWRAGNLEKLDGFIGRFAARHLGEIRAHLARQGTPIGPYDLQIAAMPAPMMRRSSPTTPSSSPAYPACAWTIGRREPRRAHVPDA